MGSREFTVSALPKNRLSQFSSLLADVVSESGRVRISEQELHLAQDTVQMVVPSRAEMEQVRGGRGSITAYLFLSCGFDGNPSPIPMRTRNGFASFVTTTIKEKTGVQLSSQQISLIGENGVVFLPDKRKLEDMKEGRAGALYYAMLALRSQAYESERNAHDLRVHAGKLKLQAQVDAITAKMKEISKRKEAARTEFVTSLISSTAHATAVGTAVRVVEDQTPRSHARKRRPRDGKLKRKDEN